jgi:death-on-curing protein
VTEYLDMSDVVWLIESQYGHTDVVRDWGLLESAVHRPQSLVFGQEAYPDPHTKAASLLESLTRNHQLLDGNKRLGVRAVALCYGYNRYALRIPDAVEGDRFIRSVAAGEYPPPKIAEVLSGRVRSS